MPQPIAYFRNEFVPVDQARVSIRSKALNYGLGCFEGIRAYWNASREQLYVFRMKEHYGRLQTSCRILGLTPPVDMERMCEATLELLRRNEHREDIYIRPIVYIASELLSPMLVREDNEFAIYTLPLCDYHDPKGVTACVASWTRLQDNMIPVRAKPTAAYLNSALARSEAEDRGCDEAVLLNARGFVSEGSAEHIFLVIDGELVTPSTEDDNLNGITRATMAELAEKELGCKVTFRHVNRTELYCADELFFCGTGVQIVPVIIIDGRTVGDGKLGPVTRELQHIYSRVVRAEHDAYADWCTPVY